VANSAQDEEKKLAAAGKTLDKPVFPALRHFKFGAVSTLVTCAVGVPILYWELKVSRWTF
jgi:hypothetical protein